ncbi:cytochrome c [Kingella kingae]|nr:cytochrome c [Kingella kingae]MDK4526389.1 cytochrome c [Kingella kingae]MDK4531827.1 cytochrome c [Kingella kingae]
MMKKITILATCVLLTLSACGDSGGATGANGAAMGGKGDISQNRSTAFKSFMPTFSGMGKVVKGDEAYDVEKFKAQAAQFAEEAKVPFEYFQNDPQGNGDALPVIWQNAADFKAEQDKFLAAVDKLNAAAQNGNLEQIKAAYGDAGASCKSCHSTYRRPK